MGKKTAKSPITGAKGKATGSKATKPPKNGRVGKIGKPAAKAKNGPAVSNGKRMPAASKTDHPGKNGHQNGAAVKQPAAAKKKPVAAPVIKSNPRVVREIQRANAAREQHKDLAGPAMCKPAERPSKTRWTPELEKDRVVLMVRDPFWLQACWDVSRQNVQRARAAMKEHWHAAKPVLRLLQVETGTTTSTAERVVRDIEIHGGVKNWYIDVDDPPTSYRVDLGYLADGGKFFSLCRSNVITTPSPGSSDAIDENWTDIAENYEKIYALSGGFDEDNAVEDLRELFEERLRRPMGSPVVTRYGHGAEAVLQRRRDFKFEVDAEMIIYGSSKPDAHVTLGGEPVKLRPDGTFTVRLSMPDKRQVIPAVASSVDGVEQRTIVLAVERNTKVMEPKIRESGE